MSKTGGLLFKQYMKFFRSGQGFENVLKKVRIPVKYFRLCSNEGYIGRRGLFLAV